MMFHNKRNFKTPITLVAIILIITDIIIIIIINDVVFVITKIIIATNIHANIAITIFSINFHLQ